MTQWRARMTRAMRHAALFLMFLLGALACAPGDDSPQHVVSLYFDRIARDPIGTLPLLSDAFHGEHGLRVTTRESARAIREGRDTPGSPGAAADLTTPGELSRARLGWIAVHKRDPVRTLAPTLTTELVEAAVEDRVARITVRVTGAGFAPFLQLFVVSRDAEGAWRIDAITQEGVAIASRAAALAAAPSRARTVDLLRTGR